MNPLKAGIRAYDGGLPRGANPLPPGMEHEAWDLGWSLAWHVVTFVDVPTAEHEKEMEMSDPMRRDLTDLTPEQLATEALTLARTRFHSKVLASDAIDLRDACDNEQPAAELARRIIDLIDRLYEAQDRLGT